MASDRIIRYDREFIDKFEKLKEILEGEDHPLIHRYLIDSFGYIFQTFQYYAKEIRDAGLKDFDEADGETKRELMRPLSFRQYRILERSFSRWKDEEENVIWSAWDFLHDNGDIYGKKVMSSAEVCAFSAVLENVYMCLATEKKPRRKRKDARKDRI